MTLRLANYVLFYGYVAMLLGVGGSGVFVAAWELARVFFIDLAPLAAVDRATAVDQYRFLKAMELSFGVFAAAYRREIFSSRKANRVFLAGVGAGVFARALSLPLDGRPRPMFVAFLVLEIVCGIVVYAYSRKTLVAA